MFWLAVPPVTTAGSEASEFVFNRPGPVAERGLNAVAKPSVNRRYPTEKPFPLFDPFPLFVRHCENGVLLMPPLFPVLRRLELRPVCTNARVFNGWLMVNAFEGLIEIEPVIVPGVGPPPLMPLAFARTFVMRKMRLPVVAGGRIGTP